MGPRHRLSIVKHLVELHGASVEASSDGPGLGAMFSVRLPVTALTAGASGYAMPACI